ncbi:AsmA family protein, partial [Salmonella sp. s51944]
FQKPDAQLIRLSEKTNNWTFDMKQSEGEEAQQPSSWSFRLDNILFDQGRVRVDDKVSRADVEILIDPLGKPLPFNEVTGDKDKKGNDKVGDYVFGL